MRRLTRIGTTLGLAMGIAGLACPAFGQAEGAAPTPAPSTGGATGGVGGGGGTNSPGTIGAPPRTQQPDPGRTNNPFPDQVQRPIFLSGRVMLDSGTPPPEPVTIERVCNGNPRAEAYTDSKGRFSFQLGQNNGMMQDASMGSNDRFPGLGQNSSMGGGGSASGMNGGISERDLNGCEIRASLPGFRSDVLSLSGRRAFDNPDLGTIILHRMGNVEGVTVSAISLNAPKEAKKSYDKGRDLLKKKKLPEAQKELEKAVELYPQYATAMFELGRAKEAQNDLDGARKSYEQAIVTDAKYLYPYRQLIAISVKQQKWQEVADTSKMLVKLDPVDFPDAHYFNSVANYYLKNYDDAEKSIREVQKLDPNNRMPKSTHLLGAILIEKQDYVGAAVQMRKYLSLLPAGAPDADNVKKQVAELERFTAAPKAAPEPQ